MIVIEEIMSEVANAAQQINIWIEALKIIAGPASALIAVWLTSFSARKRFLNENLNNEKKENARVKLIKKETLYSSLLIYEKMYLRYHYYKSIVYRKISLSEKYIGFYVKALNTLTAKEIRIVMLINIYFNNELKNDYNRFNETLITLNEIMKTYDETEVFPLSREKYSKYIDIYNEHLNSLNNLKVVTTRIET
jgi:hypothetical protein